MDNKEQESQQKPQPDNNKPLWIRKGKGRMVRDKYYNGAYEKILSRTYKKDEIILFLDKPYEQKNFEARVNAVIESFRTEIISKNLNIGEITYKTCDNCDVPVVLLRGINIHTLINTEGVLAGSGSAGGVVVGEEYSLNFFNNTPFDKWNIKKHYTPYKPGEIDEKKDKIVVAVLDTGFDVNLIDHGYLWKSTDNNIDPNCYKEAESGWNFSNLSSAVGDGSPNFEDNHPGKHGSIVSQFIINEFRKSTRNAVQIMPLKTHDEKGQGDLFGIICAIYFAIAKGANIINASWGFYYYYQDPIPFLSRLINETLKEKGILFIAAAGNKFEAEEKIAKEIYLAENGVPINEEQLRNLAIHNFYPARLSHNENSVITVTTTNGKTVSPTQNYSHIYADLGVLPDKEILTGMKFQVPFPGSSPKELISGSSFATAVATGIIGAYCAKSLYKPNLNKSIFLNALSSSPGTGALPTILVKDPILAIKHIKEGAYTK